MGVTRFKKQVWLSWIFKGSALLQIQAVLFILFVLVNTWKGSYMHRSAYILANENWVTLSWISSMIAIFSIVGTFSVLTFILNHSYRFILFCAWCISVVGAMIAFLNHFAQMTIIPVLLEWLNSSPSSHLANHLGVWDQLSNMLVMLVIPTCFALSGFFYTAVMFLTQAFPKGLSWWSFFIWTILLLGVVFLHSFDHLDLLFASLILFGYVPWLWSIGEKIKMSEEEKHSKSEKQSLQLFIGRNSSTN